MPDPREVAAQDILKRVFRVRTTETAGTCFLAGTSQHLLTAKHVVANGNEPRNGVQVSVRGEWRAASVTILASHDVAVLCLEVPLETPPLPLDKVSAPVRQMNVGIYGFPNHSELGPWQSARVDGPLDDGSWQLGFETALPDHLQGASGGPVLNDRNEVMGIFVSHSPLVPQHAAFTPVSIFSGLLDFSITTPNALRCCVFLSDAGMSRATKLEAAVEAGSRIAATRLHRGLEPPQRFVARECFKDQDAYATAVRLLCVSDVVVVDVTEFEPASLLLLGIRSAVRAGVTIATLATPLTIAELGKAPFNIKELNLVSHSDEWLQQDPPLYRVLSQRMCDGIEGMKRLSGYDDSVCFAAVRRLPAKDRRPVAAPEGALVLCSYAAEYANTWRNIQTTLRSELEQRWPDPPPTVSRAVDLNAKSGRLISQTMYSALRRSELCVVDWTGWPANVFFELGVRLAIHPLGAHSIIQSNPPATAQQQLLIEHFRPELYDGETSAGVFKGIVSAHLLRKAEPDPTRSNPTYAIASEYADVAADAAAVPIYRELLESARLMMSDESAGMSAVLYPRNPKLVKLTEDAIIERLLAAWGYMNSNLAGELANSETRDTFVAICNTLSQLLSERNPDKAREIYESQKRLG